MVQLLHDIDVLLLGKLLLACSPQNRLQYTDNMVARGAAAIATVASFIAATRVCAQFQTLTFKGSKSEGYILLPPETPVLI